MKGICFKENLFNKVVSREKTQTRRMVVSRTGYFQVESRNGVIFDIWQTDDNEWCGENLIPVKPKYDEAEIVYLKEPFVVYEETYEELKTNASGLEIAYKYGNNRSIEDITGNSELKWVNKLFMPERYARYYIEITAVRAERLQDISEEDCVKEGIEYSPEVVPIGYPFGAEFPYNNGFHNYTTAKEAYAALINKISGKGTWEKNPFVWVYDFKLIDKSETIL